LSKFSSWSFFLLSSGFSFSFSFLLTEADLVSLVAIIYNIYCNFQGCYQVFQGFYRG
jgi:hypothetical protein